jgi:hypothetical protein
VNGYRYVARHEAGHAAAGVLLGHLPTTIEVRRAGAILGSVEIPFELNERNANDLMKIMLAAWIADEEEPPSWPILDVGTGGDYGMVVALTKYLGLDESGYRRLVTDTWTLAAEPEFALLSLAFRTALEYWSVLGRRLIVEVVFCVLDNERVAELFLDQQPTKEEAAA